MPAEFNITTTGTQDPVILEDLGYRVLNHPTTNLDLLLEYSSDEIQESSDLETAITNGWITVEDENGSTITSVTSVVDHDHNFIIEDTVSPAQTKVVIPIDKSVSNTFSWFIEVRNDTSGKYKSQIVNANHDGTNISHNINNILGIGPLVYIIDIIINGTDVELKVTNSESNDIDLKIRPITI